MGLSPRGLPPLLAQLSADLGDAEAIALRMTQTRWPASPKTDAIVCQLETIATLLRGLPRADHDATTR
jgi:hypothetical protein